MAEIVLLHSALGPRPGVAEAADLLRAAGHTVHIPTYFDDDRTFDDYRSAMIHVREIGVSTFAARARAAVEALPTDLVYVGFSLGATFAAQMAASRPGARAALLLHGAPQPAAAGISSWPAATPMQIHFAAADRWRSDSAIAALGKVVRASGSECTVFDYPGSAHLFADPSLAAEYDPALADLMWQRVLRLLADLDRGAGHS